VRADPYSRRVRELFAAPVHAGNIDGAVSAYVDDQGVRLRLAAVAEGGTVRRLAFRAYGCPHVIAAAEAFCAAHEGGPESALLEFEAAGLIQELSVPKEKTGRILVLEDAVRALGRSLRGA
jgi:NifU-like protein involved in Fe-S cluster formation